jgi:AraC-like DNA-binding protein
MNAPIPINRDERSITAGQIQARLAHVLRRVPVFAPMLCHVRQGEKLVQSGEHSMQAGPQHLILFPAGQELSIANYPGKSGAYIADVISLTPELLRNFRLRHGAAFDAQVNTSVKLCVPLDRHTALAWDNLLGCIAADAPHAMRLHYTEGVLLALSLNGHIGPLLTDRRDPLAARVEQLLMLDPAANWTVMSVAERLHLGASTLRRQLADEGSSFSRILEQVRLGLALQWIQTSDRPIGEIAEASGYASASRFAVRFRQHYGLSPRELRAAI